MENLLKILLLTLSVAGCSSNPVVQFIDGGYYVGGDPSCVRYKSNSNGTINCYDRDNRFTGKRSAMTDQQLEMYRHNQTMKSNERNSRRARNCVKLYNTYSCQ